MHQAAESDQLDIAELLLQYKANPNINRDDGESPLHLAISRSLKDMIALLLRYGANPNILNTVNSLTPLDYAEGKADIYNLIKNTRFNTKNEFYLAEPQASPSPEGVKSLVEPEIEDSTKNTLYQ